MPRSGPIAAPAGYTPSHSRRDDTACTKVHPKKAGVSTTAYDGVMRSGRNRRGLNTPDEEGTLHTEHRIDKSSFYIHWIRHPRYDMNEAIDGGLTGAHPNFYLAPQRPVGARGIARHKTSHEMLTPLLRVGRRRRLFPARP